MKSEQYYNDKSKIEKKGYEFHGAYIPCPASGGDHDLELWENKKTGNTIEVCPSCQTVSSEI